MARKSLTLEEISAEVGRLFGTTEMHARRWLDQRKTLLEALGTVRDKASTLMGELGGEGALAWPRGKRKRGGGATRAVPASPLNDTPRKRRGRRKISDETRAKMRAAAQRRWAAKGSNRKG